MTTWYSKDLGDGVEALGPTDEIEKAWMLTYIASGRPLDMAVFTKYPTETNIVTAFFTPSAHTLAEMFGATPCEKPPRDGLRLLVGDERCWEHLFPSTGNQPEDKLYE